MKDVGRSAPHDRERRPETSISLSKFTASGFYLDYRNGALQVTVSTRPECLVSTNVSPRVERERRWVLLKIPRGDIDGVGEGK